MSRTAIPLYVGNQLITVAHANTYWRDNEAAAWPYDSIGGLAYATGAADLTELEIGEKGQFLQMNDDADAPTWEGWAKAAIYTATALQTFTTATLTIATLDTYSLGEDAGFTPNPPVGDKITIPAGWDGWYLVEYTISFYPNAVGEREAYIYKNGATILDQTRTTYQAIDNLLMECNGAGIVYLVATDEIQLRAYQNSGGNLNTLYAYMSLSLLAGG